MAWSETFRSMARMLKGAAEDLCGGRLVLTHEGGYSAAYVPFIGLAVIEELSGIDSGVEDPYRFICEHAGQQDLQPHQETAIAASEKLLANLG
jgi:acetoin utilization deacetylase AcuC-like enzyme